MIATKPPSITHRTRTLFGPFSKLKIGHKNFHMMSMLRKSIAYIFIFVWYVLFSIKSIDGRVAGKVGGGAGNYHSGKLSLDSISLLFGISVHRCADQLNRKFNLKMKKISIFAFKKMKCTQFAHCTLQNCIHRCSLYTKKRTLIMQL